MADKNLVEVIHPIVRAFRAGQKLQGPMTDALADGLSVAGFTIDRGDTKQLLSAGLPAWRSKQTAQIVETARRRLIDLVVYSGNRIEALIEVESDLNDLRENGVSNRAKGNNYDVFSIARDSTGGWFHSYHSLERMAVASMCVAELAAGHGIMTRDTLVHRLEGIRSDSPSDHNPSGIPIILVSVQCRSIDQAILRPRMQSLNATLICANVT